MNKMLVIKADSLECRDGVNFHFPSGKVISIWFSMADGVEELHCHVFQDTISVSYEEPKRLSESVVTASSIYLS